MNRVTPQTPLDEVLTLMRRDGYVLMEDALTPAQIETLTGPYNQQLAQHLPKPGADTSGGQSHYRARPGV